MIQNESVRVRVIREQGKHYVEFDCREPGGEWRTVLATALSTLKHWRTNEYVFYNRHPVVEWTEDGGPLQSAAGFFHETHEEDGAITLRGTAGPHEIEQRIVLTEPGRVNITTTDRVSAEAVALSRLMTVFYFIPDNRKKRDTEPLDFAWLPNLHQDESDVCGDHVFRSPAAVVQSHGLYAGIVPDLDLLARHRPALRHALDLRAAGASAPGDTVEETEAPRLSYGFCTWHTTGHVYYRHDPAETAPLPPGEYAHGLDLFLGQADGPEQVVGRITSHLWDRHGRKLFEDVRPQVMPFEEYGRRYAYVNELPASLARVTIDGTPCAGINNPRRRGSNFHAWENDLHVSYGIRHYADKWGDAGLRRTADEIMNLIFGAPQKSGAFPCVYNFETGKYEAAFFETALVADPYDGYDAAPMGVCAWWFLYFHEHVDQRPELLERASAYARFLCEQQLPSGAVPTYYFADLSSAKPLRESGTSAIGGAVLAKVARLTGDGALKDAALACGHFVDEHVIPDLAFTDYEAFYSCSPKALHWIDLWTGIRPHNNLSLQWACDQFLALFQLTADEHWLRRGEYLVGLLSLYQQVWNPPYYGVHLFGGFGVMNTDGEWNDGRQARFVSTYADYYTATGKLEYLERAIAACRAAFALMDMHENHANGINAITRPEKPAGQGYSSENIFHQGPHDDVSGWSGFNWGAGGGLAAAAYLERQFGSVWVDGAARRAVPIDGAAAEAVGWTDTEIRLNVTSALTALPLPYTEPRTVTIKFGRLDAPKYTVVVNGVTFDDLSIEDLRRGITVPLP